MGHSCHYVYCPWVNFGVRFFLNLHVSCPTRIENERDSKESRGLQLLPNTPG